MPSWISNDHAIWWTPKFGQWAIGPLNAIGSNTRGLIGIPSDKNYLGMPYDQKYGWVYKQTNYFYSAGANDIEVQCKGNTYLDSEIVEFLISMSNSIFGIFFPHFSIFKLAVRLPDKRSF